MEAMKLEDNYIEIQSTLIRLHKSKCPVTLWQKSGGARNQIESFIQDIDMENGHIHLCPIGKKTKFDFNRSFTVYFKGEDRSLLFKQDIIVNDSNMVVMDIPKEAHVLEKRVSDRLCFGVKSNRYSFVEIYSESEQSMREFVLPIYDVSNTGVALILNKTQTQFLKKGEIIYIHRLDDYGFDEPVAGQILYQRSYYYDDKGQKKTYTKVGIHFEKEIDQQLIYYLSGKRKLSLTDE